MKFFVALCLLLALASAVQVGELVVLQWPMKEKAPLKGGINGLNVAGVLAHLGSAGGVHSLPPLPLPAGNPFKKTSLTYLLTVSSAPSTNPFETPVASFPIFLSTPQKNGADLINTLLSGETNQFSPAASFPDILSQISPESLILSISSNSEILTSISPKKQLSRNALANIISINYQNSLKVTGKAQSQTTMDLFEDLFQASELSQFNIKNSDGTYLFDETIKEDRAFLLELKIISTLLATLEKTDLASLLEDNNPDLITFSSTSLEGLLSRYGSASEKYQGAWSKLVGTIESVNENLKVSQDKVFEVLLLNAENGAEARPKRAVYKRDFYNVAGNCYPDQATCLNSTNSCNERGTCELVKKNSVSSCYRCKCIATRAGESCEFGNLATSLHTTFWISVFVVVLLIMVCYNLAYMDPGTDTVLFRTPSSKPKKD